MFPRLCEEAQISEVATFWETRRPDLSSSKEATPPKFYYVSVSQTLKVRVREKLITLKPKEAGARSRESMVNASRRRAGYRLVVELFVFKQSPWNDKCRTASMLPDCSTSH
jgi:hypothetical protein